MVDSQIEGTRERVDALTEAGITWKWNEDMNLQFNSKKDKFKAIELLNMLSLLED